jgi:hypothetical protein
MRLTKKPARGDAGSQCCIWESSGSRMTVWMVTDRPDVVDRCCARAAGQEKLLHPPPPPRQRRPHMRPRRCAARGSPRAQIGQRPRPGVAHSAENSALPVRRQRALFWYGSWRPRRPTELASAQTTFKTLAGCGTTDGSSVYPLLGSPRVLQLGRARDRALNAGAFPGGT